jgi:hypothetical protein
VHGSVETLLGPAAPVFRRPEPLLRPARQRAVLAALVAAPRPGRELDLDRLLPSIASRRPVDRLPRRTELTTQLGVRLLLDHGPSMGPFLADLPPLVDAVRRVAGAEAVEVFATMSGPAAAIAVDGDETGGPVSPVPTGPRPLLLVSDLGIGPGGPPPADWLELARAASAAGSPLVVLVPYPPARWPAWAVPRMALVHWDRPATATTAIRAARRAAQLAGARP